MKSPPNNNPLDTFIRDTLKSPDVDLPPFDWSEIEMLLRHEPKSIPHINYARNKKPILISVAAVIILIGLFGIFKIASYYFSLPEKTETVIDSAKNTFTTADTQKNSNHYFSGSELDTVKIDSSSIAHTRQKTYFVPAYDTFGLRFPSRKKIKNPLSADSLKAIQRRNTSETDTASIPVAPRATVPAVDTANITAPVNIKREDQLSADTVNKNAIQPKRNPRNKKLRLLKPSSPLPETQPDSLKQR